MRLEEKRNLAGEELITPEAKAVARVGASKPEVSASGEGRYV